MALQISGDDYLEREQKWEADKKYHAARSAWGRRRQVIEGKGYTWGQWFQRKFGEKLTDYAKRKAEERSSREEVTCANPPPASPRYAAPSG